MFHDLDASLAALLTHELGRPDVSITSFAPDDQFPPDGLSLPAVSLFLYDVRENLHRRGTEWEQERQPDRVTTQTRPPARVDCSYLVTAWPAATSGDPVADQHRLLGQVMKVLLRHRRFPSSHLQGELAGQTPPLPTTIIASDQLASLGFWRAMGIRPRTVLLYGITLSVDLFDPEPLGREVDEPVVRMSANEPGSPLHQRVGAG